MAKQDRGKGKELDDIIVWPKTRLDRIDFPDAILFLKPCKEEDQSKNPWLRAKGSGLQGLAPNPYDKGAEPNRRKD